MKAWGNVYRIQVPYISWLFSYWEMSVLIRCQHVVWFGLVPDSDTSQRLIQVRIFLLIQRRFLGSKIPNLVSHLIIFLFLFSWKVSSWKESGMCCGNAGTRSAARRWESRPSSRWATCLPLYLKEDLKIQLGKGDLDSELRMCGFHYQPALLAELWIRIHWIRIRIQHSKWLRINPDPRFWWPKTEGKNTVENFFIYFFLQKIAIYFCLSYRRSL